LSSNQHFLRFAAGLLTRNRPVYVHYAVTDHCNLACPACSIWQRSGELEELKASETAELGQILRDLGCVQVSLGGGEPSMREDLPEIVRNLSQAGLRVRVLTNGVAMTPDKAEALFAAGMADVSFSLDSLDTDLQSELDAVKNAPTQRIENLIGLARLLDGRPGVPILNTVVSRRNLAELPRLLELAEALGFFASFIPVHLAQSVDGEHQFFGDDQSLAFGPEDEAEIRSAFEFLLNAKKSGRPIVNSASFLRLCADYLTGKGVAWPCLAGRAYLSISPAGKVAPCHAFEGKWEVGFRDFPAAWRTKEYRARLKEAVAGCEGCLRPCWAEVAFMMTEPSSLFEMAGIQRIARRKKRDLDLDEVRNRFGLSVSEGS
jgi:radical SAM protein with 4Fe4S-binding SPASM domain